MTNRNHPAPHAIAPVFIQTQQNTVPFPRASPRQKHINHKRRHHQHTNHLTNYHAFEKIPPTKNTKFRPNNTTTWSRPPFMPAQAHTTKRKATSNNTSPPPTCMTCQPLTEAPLRTRGHQILHKPPLRPSARPLASSNGSARPNHSNTATSEKDLKQCNGPKQTHQKSHNSHEETEKKKKAPTQHFACLTLHCLQDAKPHASALQQLVVHKKKTPIASVGQQTEIALTAQEKQALLPQALQQQKVCSMA